MSDNIFKTEPQIYRFEFGCDEKIYSTQFMGKLPLGADKGIIREVRKHLLEESSRVIWSYLEHNHISYSDFTSCMDALDHDRIMKQADFLLHSHSCNPIGEYLKEVNYYASMDYQKHFASSHCQGCYYAIKWVSTEHSRMPYCKIIGQSFDECDDITQGYFAIRETSENELFLDIVRSSGEPILPTFGCVDTLHLLTNIDNIKTIEQAQSSVFC